MTDHEDSNPVAAPRSRELSALAMKAQVGAALFGDEAAPLRVGRYEILETLGVGGMGVVYAAWDESLGRRVALKLLPGEQMGSDRERARLGREAQALAKLSHPNVVHVYEVGEHEHGVFVAMELVDGVSLQQWQQQDTRSARELVEIYVQAGRGLAAAHEAGLVHRDFKPANVLLGKDGRVRVVDFGLAQGPGLLAATTSGTGRKLAAPPSSPVTRTGALAGTPAYMAPEQLAGLGADARADQFSFCVALYEALVGCRPFEVMALRMASERVVPPPTKGTRRLPLLLGRVLRRGLAIEPSRRFADMNALLGVIESHASWRRRAWGLAAPVAVGLGVVWLGGRGEDPIPAAAELNCVPDRGPPLEWGTRKGTIEKAIVGTRKPFAADAWRSVDRTLGKHAQEWNDAHVQACQDAGGPEASSPATRCLERDALRFAAVLEELERVDGETVIKTEELLETLPPVAACLGADAGLDAESSMEESSEALESLEHVRVIAAAGRDREANEQLVALLDPSRSISASLRSDLLLIQGEVLGRLEDFDEARDTLAHAHAVARDSARSARAVLALITLAVDLERSESAEDLSLIAARLIEQLGRPPELRADLLDAQGRRWTEQDPTKAVGLHQEALRERAVVSQGADDRSTYRTKNLLANALAVAGQTTKARAQYEEVLAFRERVLGRRHPEYAKVLFNLGLLALDTGELEEARDQFERALEIERSTYGPDATQTTRTEAILANTLLALDEPEPALALATHAWDEVQRSGLPPGHSDRVAALRALAAIELQLGHHPQALALHRLLATEAGTDDAPEVLHNIAWLQCQLGECATARPFVDQARRQVEKILLGEHTDGDVMLRLYILHTSALVSLAEGKLVEGRTLLGQVLEQAKDLEGTDELVKEATTELAQARSRLR